MPGHGARQGSLSHRGSLLSCVRNLPPELAAMVKARKRLIDLKTRLQTGLPREA